MRTAAEWKRYYSNPEFHEKYFYEGKDLGMSCTEEGTSFILWSPMAQEVFLNFYRKGEDKEAYLKVAMERNEKGVWSWRTKEELHGIYYDFVLKIEGETVRSADPYAKACGVNGRRSMAVNLKRTNPDGWEEDKAPKKPAENIIYELHVKEFSWDESGGFPGEYRGKFKAFTCENTTLYQDGIHATGMEYLKDLGITHVQLMPAYDYGSVDEAGDKDAFNWGYDPVNYNVPEGSYATDAADGNVRITQMKEMIQSLHRQGFRVIMDVVYNHTYSLDSWLQRTAPWYFYRVWEDGQVSNGSACGNDIASERPMCGKYILESVLYWTEEYHIDGFRFDLMGLLDVELMNRIRYELDQRYGKGEKLLFGEPWAADETAMEKDAVPALKRNLGLLDENVGIFCDDTRDGIKGSALRIEEPGFVNGASGLEKDILESAGAWCLDVKKIWEEEPARAKAPSQIVTYVSSHDNQTLWDKLADTANRPELMRLNRMTAALYMTCQGNLFFLSGEEFARTKEGHENTYNAPISLNRLDWEQAWRERDLVEYYKGLIGLRKRLPGLCDKSVAAKRRFSDIELRPGLVSFMVDNRDENDTSRWKSLYVIYNSRRKAQELVPPEGAWEILLDIHRSDLWREPKLAGPKIEVEPISVLVLGQPSEEKGEREQTV